MLNLGGENQIAGKQYSTNNPPMSVSGGESPKNINKNKSVTKSSISKAKNRSKINKSNNIPIDKVLQQIKLDSEMNPSDLINISNERVKRRLKESEGLLWHYRLNHSSYSQMALMKLDMPELQKVTLHDDIKNCLHCRLAKAKKLPFNKVRTQATRILEVIHTDTAGPITPSAYRTGHKYFVTFTDGYSRYAEAYSMYDKTEAHVALAKYLERMREILSFDYQPIKTLQNLKEGRPFTCVNEKIHLRPKVLKVYLKRKG